MKYLLPAVLVLCGLFIFGRRITKHSDEQRLITWTIAWREFLVHPILGTGPDTFENVFRRNRIERYDKFGYENEIAANAHNDILQVLVTTGIIGILAYLGLIFYAMNLLSGPRFGAIVALFVGAKLSPIPMEAIILAAMICGSVGAFGEVKFRKSLIGISVLLLLFVLQLAIADYYANRTALYAVRANPFELTYKTAFLRSSASQFNTSDNPELKALLTKEMRKEVAVSQMLRPNAGLNKNIQHFGKQLGLAGPMDYKPNDLPWLVAHGVFGR